MKKGLLLIILCLCLTGCIFTRENKKVELLTGMHYAEMKIKKYGVIKLELDASKAPITVTNFINLVEEKFYDGLTFHRIIEGFMMQGGDPTGTGTGGSKETIKGEFTANGINNTIKHKRGVISMARSSEYNSASSQFFIVHQDTPSLDGQYAAFGKVISGMNVVDKICKTVKSSDGNDYIEKNKQPVIEYIKIIEK